MVDGNHVRWQKWSFVIGFNGREGLTLNNLCYQDNGKKRSVLYRASLSEMVVPYGDPAPQQRPPMSLRFLTPDQRSAAETEWKQIRAAEPWGATYLARQTLDWARKHPDDPRLPEALHRAVQASRYRCTDADTGKYSQQAFDLLHRKYPKSSWTARTKYWYK